MTEQSIDELCVNTIRTLAIDAVQKANSGHPGAPMGMAPVAYTLWLNILNYDPTDPMFPNRDRFVLSNGHASMLLYSLLHLAGVRQLDANEKPTDKEAVSLDEIKNFRQLDSKCPGHPEHKWTSGVETTTGPLGQGFANSVGMAIASQWLGKHFNRDGFPLFDYNVYAYGGDGCMMEGISSEAASMAGFMRLPNLCWIYDSNRITIEGHTDLTFNEDVGTRFLAYGWDVIRLPDANDRTRVEAALKSFKANHERPTLIIVESHIAYGSPNKHDTAGAHGEPLGEEEVKLTKRALGFPEDKSFYIPAGVTEHFRQAMAERGGKSRQAWEKMFADYKVKYPELHAELTCLLTGGLPQGWDKGLPTFPADAKGLATRESSAKVLNGLAVNYPWLIGGAADLAPSTKTRLTFDGAGDFNATNYGARNFHFGIREHAMAAVLNGLAVSKIRPYGSGFLIFVDYLKPSLRLSAIMEQPVIYIFTHDSIGVGEDGPTHQPIEQLASLRSLPGIVVFRPADANEVTEAWRVIAQLKHEPAVLALSRQALPTLDRSKYGSAAGVAKGAYVLHDAQGDKEKPAYILIATGSEVPLALAACEALAAEGIKGRVVSMPSWDLFEKQDQAYKDTVLPPDVVQRVSVEAGSTLGWERYIGDKGKAIGMTTFGASAPLKDLLKKFGFTQEHVVDTIKTMLRK
ncbi:MAG: transketolase [Cyanobacteria bacterium REEB67]|nr:transketolase [Cyanobacteria bacterium REEB67]